MSVLNLGLWALGAHLHPDCTQVPPLTGALPLFLYPVNAVLIFVLFSTDWS